MTITFKIIMLALVFTIAFSHDNDQCSYPWRKIGNGCYLLESHKVSGDEAYALCRRGTRLAVFETIEELMLVKYELQRMKTGHSDYFGGRNVNQHIKFGDWRWIKDGKLLPMAYFAFEKNTRCG